MKTCKRLLMFLLALAMVLSLGIAASAEEEDTSPYLSANWLDCDDSGWYVREEEPMRGIGMPPTDGWAVVFYLNTWNGSDWETTPVDVEAGDYLNIRMMRDDPETSVHSGPASEHFCWLGVDRAGLDKDTEVYYTMDDGTKVSLGVSIHRDEAALYTGPAMNNANYIVDNYHLDPFAENVVYFGFQSDFWKLDSAELTEGGDKVEWEPISNVMYKITVKDPYNAGNWGVNFCVTIQVTAKDDPEWTETWDCWYGLNSQWPTRKASFDLNGMWYGVYDYNGESVLAHEEPMDIWNEWGDQEYMLVTGDLPEGVSYDYDTNTLTLNNASLNHLSFNGKWWNEEEGRWEYNLPTTDLTIELIGENEIINENYEALSLCDHLNVTITGDGSLYVKTSNSPDYTESDDEHFWHVCSDAMRLWNNSNLTIAGNANVTVELEGSGLEDHYDEEGNYLGSQNAFLSALRIDEGDLTLKDNAALTTILPKDAHCNGPFVAEEDRIWEDDAYPGGYRGIENFKNITVQDNATLNTTSLRLNEWWDENGFAYAATFTQTGGTVNITALSSYGEAEQWEWNEETQESVVVGMIDHRGYEGLTTNWGTITISGGELNISATATDAEKENSVYAHLMGGGYCDINISGGTVNLTANCGGCAFEVGNYGEEPDYPGVFTMTGGQVNVTGTDPYNALELPINTTGTLNLRGGEINLTGSQFFCFGTLNVSGGSFVEKDGWPSYCPGKLNLTGGTVEFINCPMYLEWDATLNIDGADVTFDWDRPEMAYREGIVCQLLLTGRNSNLNVSSGSLTLRGTDLDCCLWLEGNYTQDGGTVTIDSPITDNFYAIGDRWINWAFDACGYTTINGGTLNITSDGCLDQWYCQGIEGAEETKLTINGGTINLNVSGEQGMSVSAPTEINGGTININHNGYEYNGYVFATGINVAGGSWNGYENYLEINDGTITINCPTDARGAGLYAVDPIHINGGTLDITSGMPLLSDTIYSEECMLTLGDNMAAISMQSGHRLDMLNYTIYFDRVDAEGNPYVKTEYMYWLEEDNTPGKLDEGTMWTGEGLDKATHVLITTTKCGDDAYWQIQDGVLTISGTGSTWGAENRPWMCVESLIKEVVVEEGITAIGPVGLAELSENTSISFPATLTELGDGAVAASPKLASFTIAEGNQTYHVEDGVAIVKTASKLLRTVAPATSGTYTVADGMLFIDNGAFEGCAVEKVVIPEGVVQIGNGAFATCTNLTSVNIPASVQSIGVNAFANCENLVLNVYHNTNSELYAQQYEIPMEYIHEYSDATCTDPATCKYCDATEGEALGHSYGDWVVTDATCTADGSKVKTCATCGDVVTETIEKLGHSYGDWVVDEEATCTADGSKSKTCATCGDVVTETIKAPGHSYADGVCTECGAEDPDAGKPTEPEATEPNPTEPEPTEPEPTEPEPTEPEDKEPEKDEPLPEVNFTDVVEGAYYEDGVKWAVAKGVTNGYGSAETFAPEVACTRGQIVTFLWRAQGSPEPKTTVNPFTDVVETDFFYKAVLWAVENNITAGYGSDTIFNPMGECTRAQVATFLWRAQGEPKPTSSANPFTDVPAGAYYYDAVLWAVEMGVTKGYGSDDVYAPDVTCTRGQIVTFLYRALV